MEPKKRDYFIWCDVETTGLDPERNEILALGLIITDAEFKEIARREWVIGQGAAYNAVVNGEMSDFVEAMHTKSGLLDRVKASETFACQAEQEACAFIDSVIGPPAEEIKERPPMAGNSIYFDRRFIDQDMPELARRFHYRSLDVSTLKVLALATLPGAKEWNDSRPDPAHTPVADLEGSIAELQHWRRVLWGQGPTTYEGPAWGEPAW